jgi:hypothetical protein
MIGKLLGFAAGFPFTLEAPFMLRIGLSVVLVFVSAIAAPAQRALTLQQPRKGCLLNARSSLDPLP